jgi:hypothetical protein
VLVASQEIIESTTGSMTSPTASPTPFEELVIDLVTEGRTPEQILSFRATPKAQRRLEELIAKEHAGSISERETAELDSYMQFNHLVILLKARAAEMLASRNS